MSAGSRAQADPTAAAGCARLSQFPHELSIDPDITGARWGLAGAEAILELRAIITNGEVQEYWRFHLARTTPRAEAHYENHIIPAT